MDMPISPFSSDKMAFSEQGWLHLTFFFYKTNVSSKILISSFGSALFPIILVFSSSSNSPVHG